MSNDSRSSARPATKCMLQRTDHKKSSQRRNSRNSSRSNTPRCDQTFRLAHAIDVFGDPEQRVQVAQAALAVLHIGFDQIARLAGAAVALFALGEFGGDEFGRCALHDFLVEARGHFVVELLVAEQIARLQKAGADGHVRLGLADAFIDGARGVADFEPHVPQAIEQGLGDRLAPGGLFVGQQKQQIDVGARRQQAAAIAAGRDDGDALGLRAHLRRIEHRGGEFEQQADDIVLHLAKPLGAAAAVAVLQQQGLGPRPAFVQRRPSAAARRGAQFAVAAFMGRGQRFEVLGDRRRIDQHSSFGLEARCEPFAYRASSVTR